MKRVLMALLGIIILLTPVISLARDYATSCGDVNNSGSVNIMDATYLVHYLYHDSAAPDCGDSYAGLCGDVDNSGGVNILDATYIIKWLYFDSAAPDCGETGVLTDIDDNVYQTVKIGDQWWMAENLKVTHYSNGDSIPNVTDSGAWLALATGAYCNYDNDESIVTTYGRLYNWYAVDDGRNLAPIDWHVPSDNEWMQLEMYLGMSQAQANSTECRGTDEGGKLKEIGTMHWLSPNTGATNESGFNALPGGYRADFTGYYEIMGYGAFYWSSSVMYRHLYYNLSGIIRLNYPAQGGFSVRCIAD
nr:hypothetical protein [candidate division Zixibacteria bacterium]